MFCAYFSSLFNELNLIDFKSLIYFIFYALQFKIINDMH